MSQWLRNTAPTFAIQFAPNGTPADVGTVTVTVTRAGGTVIATDAATTKTGSGATTQYEYALAVAQTANLDILRLDWKRVSTGEIITTYE